MLNRLSRSHLDNRIPQITSRGAKFELPIQEAFLLIYRYFCAHEIRRKISQDGAVVTPVADMIGQDARQQSMTVWAGSTEVSVIAF